MNAITTIEENKAMQVIDPQPTPAAMLAIAVQNGAGIDMIERLMALQERMTAAAAKSAYDEAFSGFKSEAIKIIKARKVTDGPLKNKSYAELHDIVNAVTPALSRNGLSFSWKLTKDERDWLEVTCTVRHVGGHVESVSMGGPPDAGGAKNAIQARASTVSYLERYTLKAALGVAEQDDDTDGNPPPVAIPLELLAAAREAAMGGWKSLANWTKTIKPEERALLEPESYSLKKAAKEADAAKGGAQ